MIGPRDGSRLLRTDKRIRTLTFMVGLAGKLSGVMFSCHDRFSYSTVPFSTKAAKLMAQRQ